ncbi:MAG: LysM domain-containing protein, partial [Pseudohongiellaceae bacterium]
MNIAVFRTGLMLFQGLLISIAGCSNNYRAPVADVAGGTGYVNSGRTHRVNSGETLYAIAWIYDLDYTRLARLNNIDPPYTIYAGQTLSVDPRAVAAVATT